MSKPEKQKNKDFFVWTDDEVELLLQVANNYKNSKTMESVDWESVQKKYIDIADLLKCQLPTTEEEAKASGKDYPHKPEVITKNIVTSKLKAIRTKYRQAVDSGRKSGHGRVVLLFFELCERLWGGSPATVQIATGIETAEMNSSTEGATNCVNSSAFEESSLSDEEIEQSGKHSLGHDNGELNTLTPFSHRRDMLAEKLPNYKQSKLKRKLSTESQMFELAKQDLQIKRKVVEQLEKVDKENSETMSKLTDNMEKLTNAITDGFAFLRSVLAPNSLHQHQYGALSLQNMNRNSQASQSRHVSQCYTPQMSQSPNYAQGMMLNHEYSFTSAVMGGNEDEHIQL